MAELLQYLAILDSDPADTDALKALETALTQDGAALARPESSKRFDSLRQSLRERGELDMVAKLYDLELAAVKDADRQVALLLGKGDLYASDLLNDATAIACFEQVVALRPSDETATDTLAHLALERENWEKFVQKNLDEAGAATDPGLSAHMYLSAAKYYARFQPEASEIEEYLRKALAADPQNRQAALQLERRLRQKERWDELAALYAERAEVTTSKEERAHALLGLADVTARRRGDAAAAVEIMKKVLDADPGEPRAMRMLGDLYEMQGNHAELVALYTNALSSRRQKLSREAELGMLLQIGMIYWKRLSDLDHAEEYFRRIRKTDPLHRVGLDFYRAYYIQRNEIAKLLQLLRQVQKSVPREQDDLRRAIAIEIAEVSELELGNPEKAIDAWKALLRAEPNAEKARDALKRLYRKTEKWNALLDMMKEEIERRPADDIAGRVAGLMEVVAIYRERLGLDVMVINTYNSILKLDPGNHRALDELAAKYEELARWNDLINVLRHKSELPDVPVAEKAELLRRMADLWSNRFGNFAQAIRPLEQLVELVPSDRDAIDRLKDIYTRRRQWRQLITLLGREADTLSGEERRDKLAQMARLSAEKLGDSRLSIQIWNQVLAQAGEPAENADLADDEALAALVHLYEREKRFVALAEVYRRQRLLAANEREAVAILERLGILLSDRLSTPKLAAEAFEEILRIQPSHARALRTLREIYAEAGNYQALERLYSTLEQWDDLVDAFHGMADRIPDHAQKLALIERAAAIAAKHFDKADKIARAYERVLSVSPEHLGAAQALVPIYESTQKWARLLSTYEILLKYATTAEERLTLHLAIRDLCETRLGSKALAFQWTAKAYQLAPTRPELLDALQRLGAEAEQWAEVAAILDARIASEGVNNSERLHLLRELGRIVQVRLHQPERARDYQRRVLDLVADDPEAMSALEEIASQLSEWPDLLSVYRRRVELADSEDDKIELLFKIAFIEEERLAAFDDAARTYESILSIRPSSQRAMRSLAKLHEARGDWDGLVSVLRRELTYAPDADAKMVLHMRMGGLCENSLDRAEEALESYRAAHELFPEDRRIHQALERFLDAQGAAGKSSAARVSAASRVGVAELLLPIYEERADPERIARAIEVLRTAAEDDMAVDYDRRLASLYGQLLGDSRRAYEAGLRVLLAEPLDVPIRDVLLGHAETLDMSRDLAEHLGRALKQSASGDPTERRALAVEIARLYDERLGDTASAERAWLDVLALPAGDLQSDRLAYDALERIYRGSERFTDLRDLLLRREEATFDNERRKAIVLAICDLEEGVLDNPDGAIVAYQRVLTIDPGLMRAHKALERLYAARESWTELAETIGRELDHVKNEDERSELMYRWAELRARRLDDPFGAVELLEDVVNKKRDHARARALLEELIANPDLRLRIAWVLEPIYTHDEMWKELCTILRVQREFASTSIEAGDLLTRVAVVQEEKLSDGDTAFATWIEVLGVEPGSEKARESLRRLAAILDRFPDAASAYEASLESSELSDVALRGELLTELAQIYDRDLGNTEKAISAYRRLLDLDPGNPDTVRPATQALARLYEEEQRWPELIEIIRRQAEWVDGTGERKALLSRIAVIFEERLSDKQAAIATWREVLTEDPEDLRSLDALERLYTEGDKPGELCEILRRRVELSATPEERKQHLSRIADLLENALKSRTEAITARLEVLDHIPDDRDTLIELSRLYRAEERWADLLETLERRLAASDHLKESVELTFEIGNLLRNHLQRSAEALERYAEVLASMASHTEALTAIEELVAEDELRQRASEILAPIYEATAEYEKLAALLMRVADGTDDTREQLRCLREVAHIREHNLRDKEGAFTAAVRALKLAVSEPELPELINEVARLASDPGDLVDIYRDIAEDVFDGELQRRLYLDIADLARAARQDVELARDYYQRVLDAQPEDRRALSALESIHRFKKNYAQLHDILMRKADLCGDDLDARAAALAECAALSSDKLDRPEDAIVAWEQVLELTPENRDAVKALEKLYENSERYHDLVDLLERRLGYAFTVEEAVALRYRLGQLHEDKLGDAEAAVENYSAALGGDQEHEQAIEGLERFLDDPGLRLNVADVLEIIYVRQQDWLKLVRIYEIKLEAAEDPAERLELTRDVARLYEEQLEDLKEASRWYGRVFRETPEDLAVRDQLARLAAILNGWSDLAKIYQEYLDDETSMSPVVAEVARTLGDIYNERQGEIERAQSAYRRVLEIYPNDLATFGRLENMLVRGERWYALVEVYEEAVVSAAEDARRIELYLRAARVREDHLNDLSQAVDAYRSVLDIDPDHRKAAAELERLYEQQSQWFELSELLSTRLERSADQAEMVEIRLRLAQVLETRLQDVAGAIDQYEAVLSSDVGWKKALPSLERMVLNENYRERIAEMLEPVYRANDWWQKLVVILDTQVGYAQDPEQRVAILREIAQLHETRGGDLSLALDALSRAWLENVRDADVFDELSALAAKMGAWDQLIGTLEKGVANEYDEELVVSVLSQVAEIHETHRGDMPSAIAAWQRVASLREDEPVALASLDRLLASEGRFAELVKVIEKRAELADVPGVRRVFLHRMATLYRDELRQPAEAIAAYRQVLGVVDDDPDALDALEDLYREQKDFSELVEVLTRKIELADDMGERRELRLSAAAIYEGELKDSFEAIALLRACLEENPEDAEALQKLDQLYAAESMWPELIEVIDQRIDVTRDQRGKADLAFRAAKVVEKELVDLESAIDRYAFVVKLMPGHEGARQALDALASSEDTMERASEVLDALYRSEADYERVAELIERKLAAPAVDIEARKRQYAALAEVYELNQGDLESAFAVWARALKERPDDAEIRSELERITSQRGTWEELTALFEERLADTLDAELEYIYASKLASLYEDALGDLDRAAEKYRRALDVASDQGEVLRSLEGIYTRAGKHRELAEILAREAEATVDAAEQSDYLFRLGDLREMTLYDREGAVRAYSEVLDHMPQHGPARTALERLLVTAEKERPAIISILEPLYENEGNYGRLADLLAAKLSTTSDHVDRAQIYQRIAELAEEKLSDPVRALDATGGWLAEDPYSESALRQLERLAEASGRWGEMAARLQGIIEAGDSDELKRALLSKLGAIQLDRLGDAKGAEASFRSVLDIDAEDTAALSALQRIYRQRGDKAALAETLWRLLQLTYDTVEKRRYAAEVAELREAQGDVDGAVTAWREILNLDEGDREALDRLAVLYDRKQEWATLIDVLDQAARYPAHAEEERMLRTRIATLYTGVVGNLDEAVRAWQAVLDVTPEATDALMALEDVYRRMEDWRSVQEILLRRLDVVTTKTPANTEARIEIMQRLAKLAEEKLDSIDEAISYYYEILELSRGHMATYDELERLLGKAGRWHDVVELLEKRAELYASMGQARAEIDCLARAADMFEGPLENPDAAGEILEKILKREPRYVPALTRLSKIYENASDWERCSQVLQQALALGPTGRDAAELYFRLGEVARQRDQSTDEAVQYWGQALQADSAYVPAIAAIEEVARAAENWSMVASMVARRESLSQDAGEKFQLLVELAELHHKRLGQPAQAVPILERARAQNPAGAEDERILMPLADLYFAAGRHGDAAPIYEKLAEAAKKTRKMKEVATYRQRLGGIFEAQGDVAKALASYEEAFRVNPTDVATMAGLGRIYLGREEWENARRVYRSMVLQNIDPEIGVSKADVYYHLGIIHIKLNEPKKAKGMFQRGLELDPEHAALKQAITTVD